MQKEVFSFALQVRAGRSLTGWSQAELSTKSNVSRPTIARIESLSMQPRLETVGKIKQAFLGAGVQILDGEPIGGFSMIVTETAIHDLLADQTKD